MNKVSKVVGKQDALRLSKICINSSIFVEVLPLPDDLFEVSVKKEHERILFDKFMVICRNPGIRLEYGIKHALTMAEAVNSLRHGVRRACYVGTHDASGFLLPDQVEHVDIVGEEGETGFIIRPHFEGDVVVSYIGEEWVNGDIVDTTDGAYSWVRRWISDNHVDHWKRRYGLNDLVEIWNQLGEVEKDEFGVHLAEPFMFFPAGANIFDVRLLIEEVNPLFAMAEGDDFIGPEHAIFNSAGAGAVSSQGGGNTCSACESEVDELFGCPDGAEICSDCFNAGAH